MRYLGDEGKEKRATGVVCEIVYVCAYVRVIERGVLLSSFES